MKAVWLAVSCVALCAAPAAAQDAGSAGATDGGPLLWITATPASVPAGGRARVHWEARGYTSCSVSGRGVRAEGLKGRAETAALEAPASYTLTCAGPAGTKAARAEVGLDAPGSETLLDLLPRFALSTQAATIPLFRSMDFEPGTACSLTYQRTAAGARADWRVIDSTDVARLFSGAPAAITSWYADPALCSDAAVVTTSSAAVRVAAMGPDAPAQEMAAASGRLILRDRSIEQFKKRFGGVFFRSASDREDGNKSNLYAVGRMTHPFLLGDYSSLRLAITAQLNGAHVLTGCVRGDPPAGAQACYDPRRHATQFRAAFGNLIWTDPRCHKNDSSDPVCRNQGGFMQVSINLFDERHDFMGPGFFLQDGDHISSATVVPIYRINLKSLLPAGTETNPFHVPGLRVTAQADILPQLRAGVLLGESLGYIPPRLVKADGSPETDDEYVAHYRLSSMNIGYEVTGLSDVAFSLYEYSLKGVPAQKPVPDASAAVPASLNSPANGAVIKKTGQLSISASAGAGSTLILAVDGRAVESCADASSCSAIIPAAGLPLGTHTVGASAQAGDGSSSSASAVVTIVR